MKALCWNGKHDVRVEEVPDPVIEHPRDAIVKITSTAICGSDLHLYDGLIQTMKSGDILGHEFMGEVVELGAEVKNLAIGDRVAVPFVIACGQCLFCNQQLYSACENSNPNKKMAEDLYGSGGAGLFGYSHMYGGFAGGQAQFVRVPFADVGPIKIPDGIPDEKVLFLTDIYPTGYMAAENCSIKQGDTVAIWGAGPVGQFAIRSAFLLGAGKVIVIDQIPERLAMAKEAGAETIEFDEKEENLYEMLKQRTEGYGPHSCIDAVGMEAHGAGVGEIYDWVKMGLRLETDRPNVLRQCIQACRPGGTVSIPGVYGGFLDKINFGAAFAKGLTFKMGQTHVQKYTKDLLELVVQEKIDPSFVITHELPLSAGPSAYEGFKEHKDGCIKVVMKPWMTETAGKVRRFPQENKPGAFYMG